MAQASHGTYHIPTAKQSWVGGLELFAAVMMMIVGLFHLIIGLAAILRSSYYVVTDSYIFSYDVTGWGWAHLVLGVLVGATGIALMMGQTWARVVGMIIVGLSALGNFLFIPYQPMWSLLIIAIDVAVIWALAVHMRELPESSEKAAD
ncbi:hypothetical protein HUO13_22775 [Saccharopolyspora erythraea]|uniref:DUF7144 family membrane protein n=1 Tax=Saccharopolyspora erythraea TaxID=1836 RepID=UPI001BA87CFD|nr:hypothetical protein [Saccharopolyspora erythraea]QUH03277.1 hypothetical protein HUO13_22775 [Saccharopolyspora erythraea]